MWSVAEFDQQARAEASATGALVPLLDHAPITPASVAVAVSAARSGEVVTLNATSGGVPQSATGPDVWTLLADLGVSLAADTPACLVVADNATLAALGHLARTSPPGGSQEPVAALIGWWLDRADFPGGLPVIDVLAACRTRWMTGTTPEAEQLVGTWLAAHTLPPDGVLGTLALYRQVSAGVPLPGLAELADDAQWSYEAAQRAHTDGWDWRKPDTPGRAAVGLRARCDAADAYAAALLDDPRHRQRMACGGHVVTGTLTAQPGQHAPMIECDRLDARLRPGNGVTGWKGTATDTTPRFSTAIVSARVHHGRLRLTLAGLGTLEAVPGDLITLMPAPPIPTRQRSGRAAYRRLYNHRRSWISTGRPPTITRRPVPLDVLVAAAEAD